MPLCVGPPLGMHIHPREGNAVSHLRLLAALVVAALILAGCAAQQGAKPSAAPAVGSAAAATPPPSAPAVPAQLQFTARTLDGQNFNGQSLVEAEPGPVTADRLPLSHRGLSRIKVARAIQLLGSSSGSGPFNLPGMVSKARRKAESVGRNTGRAGRSHSRRRPLEPTSACPSP